MEFNPNEVGVNNGNIFGFPYSIEESQIVIIPVQSDITCSYSKGTAEGPKAVLEASTQLDFFSPYAEKAWTKKVAMISLDEKELKRNRKVGEKASQLIEKLENEEPFNNSDKELYEEINEYCNSLNCKVEEQALQFLNQGKKVGLLGGDHNSPLGLIKALAKKHPDFGILQIDAHADLRAAYEGFVYSHASIMFNALKTKEVSKIVQVGIRDICPAEIEIIESSKGRIKTFFDWDIKAESYKGKTWEQQCNEIIKELPQKIYISFDIDGLDPKLCPNTGTPVAGGFDLEQINFLFQKVKLSGKEIIGFDLNEVGKEEWDANVGARALYRLCNFLAD
ncbi:MAG: agmatinase family protein [Flavobacteriales bacterium]|nr:agmatinase family protein [Flavobacteriales bacterium]MCB9336030.1 agmatinase family protein [Flavobacteriales bacterium]